MVRGIKTGGRQKSSRIRATAKACAAAEATGILPLDYMLSVMRDANGNQRRRDAMATAAAPFLQKLNLVDAKPAEARGVSCKKFRMLCSGAGPGSHGAY